MSSEQNPITFDIAKIYSTSGYSVIPCHDNKIAAVPWKSYQTAKANPRQLNEWFNEQQFPNIGIVTGKVSGLVVLDFDNDDLYMQFRFLCPNLAQTQTVKTKRGYHVYFKLPPDLTVKSWRGQGVDFQSDGRYVIAPPSVVDGHKYKLVQSGLRTFSVFDLEAIEHFLSLLQISTEDVHSADSTLETNQSTLETLSTDRPTRETLLNIYRHGANNQGRNNSLFQVACLARDWDYSQDEVLNLLNEIHAGLQMGKHEPEYRRLREGQGTIKSAFSHPPRQPQPIPQPHNNQLPNVVRENLLEHKLTCVIRVIEGLRLKDIQPGQAFTIKEAFALLSGIVGRDSIYKALNALIPPLEPPRSPDGLAADKCSGTIFKMQKIGTKKSGKYTVYFMPDNKTLCDRLGVTDFPISDPLTLEDLSGAKSTRTALHKGYIERRRGQYPAEWLAKRLGVTRRTIQNYNREDPTIQVEAMFAQIAFINWSNVDHAIPKGIPEVAAHFLTTSRGKKYPCRVGIACKLLAKGEKVRLIRQVYNFYWVKKGEITPVRGMTPPQAQPAHAQSRPQTLSTLEEGRALVEIMQQPYPIEPASPMRKPVEVHPPEDKREKLVLQPVPYIKEKKKTVTKPEKPPKPPNFKRKLKAVGQEAQAQRLYRVMNKTIAIPVCRKLVWTYDERLIRNGLEVIEKRQNIRNPAGFLLMFLRSESRRMHP